MYNLLKGIIVLVAIFIASSLLSGAGIMFSNTWFSAPAELSKFVVSVSFLYFIGSIFLKVFKSFYKTDMGVNK